MAAKQPTAKNLADLYKLGPLDWEDVRETLDANLTQAPQTGRPDTTPSGGRRSTPMVAHT
jgi:hypothetical protein